LGTNPLFVAHAPIVKTAKRKELKRKFARIQKLLRIAQPPAPFSSGCKATIADCRISARIAVTSDKKAVGLMVPEMLGELVGSSQRRM
jgi:hypothetical protein